MRLLTVFIISLCLAASLIGCAITRQVNKPTNRWSLKSRAQICAIHGHRPDNAHYPRCRRCGEFIKKIKEFIPTLNTEDEKMARAIEEASIYANMQEPQAQKVVFPRDAINRVIRYCRLTWDGKSDFLEYVEKEFSEGRNSRANCGAWYKYYWIFYEKST